MTTRGWGGANDDAASAVFQNRFKGRPNRHRWLGHLFLFLPFRGLDVPVTDVDLKRCWNAAGARARSSFPHPLWWPRPSLMPATPAPLPTHIVAFPRTTDRFGGAYVGLASVTGTLSVWEAGGLLGTGYFSFFLRGEFLMGVGYLI